MEMSFCSVVLELILSLKKLAFSDYFMRQPMKLKRWLVSSRASFSFLASRPKISSTLKGMLFPCSLFTVPSLKWQSPRHLLGDSLKLIDFSSCSYFIDLVSEKNPTGLFSQDKVFCVRWASECWVQKMIKIGGFSGVKLSLNQQWFER